jgi:putative flippase GtrA
VLCYTKPKAMLKRLLAICKRTFISASFLKFLVVGSLNTALDFGVFLTLTSSVHLAIPIANIISTSAALCLSFVLNKYFVFEADHAKTGHFIQFTLLTLFNVWLVQTLVILGARGILTSLFDEVWHLNAIAKIIGVGVSMVLNFVSYKILFNRNRPASTV